MKSKLLNMTTHALCLCAGAGAGVCIKVFMTRGVPVTQGGGEIFMLALSPLCFVIGFIWGRGLKRAARITQNTGGCNERETL